MYEGYLANHTHVFGPRTKLCIVVTLFNEEEEEMRRTMEGLAQNVAQLQVEQDEVVICLVADGRINVSKSLLQYADMYVGTAAAQADQLGVGRLACRPLTRVRVVRPPGCTCSTRTTLLERARRWLQAPGQAPASTYLSTRSWWLVPTHHSRSRCRYVSHSSLLRTPHS